MATESGRDVFALPPVLSTAASVLPVSHVDLKAHTRIDADDDDAMVDIYLRGATAFVERRVGQKLITQTWTQAFSGLADKLWLAVSPVASISSVTYYDDDNASQTLTSTYYRLQNGYAGAYVERDSGSTYPTTYDRDDAVTVTMVAGHGAAPASVPYDLRQAIMLIAAHWYEIREDATPMELRSIPMGAEAIMATQRRGWL